jgi:tripartite-type tricarboxylate transporter receptor subunit TctC
MEGDRQAGQHSAGGLTTRRAHALLQDDTMNSKRLAAMAALLAGLACGAAFADYPERPLRAIVPFTPGGPNDILARVISPMLTKAIGQTVIVENRPGADGRIGIEALAKAAPDGYTILFSGGAVALIPAIKRNVPYDPIRDIQPVSELGISPYVIAVHPQVPAKNVAQLIAIAKKNPGKLNGSSGGNSTFLSLVLFQIRTGTRIVTIPYKGAGDAGLAVARGEVDMAIMDASAFGDHLRSGRVRMLALAADRRSSALPDLPTAKEAGLPDFTADSLFGVFTTGRTPPEIVRRLNVEINRIVASPEVSTRLVSFGLEPSQKSVEEFTKQYLAEIAKWKDVVARAKIPLES